VIVALQSPVLILICFEIEKYTFTMYAVTYILNTMYSLKCSWFRFLSLCDIMDMDRQAFIFAAVLCCPAHVFSLFCLAVLQVKELVGCQIFHNGVKHYFLRC
jgi:hypothetical protein